MILLTSGDSGNKQNFQRNTRLSNGNAIQLRAPTYKQINLKSRSRSIPYSASAVSETVRGNPNAKRQLRIQQTLAIASPRPRWTQRLPESTQSRGDRILRSSLAVVIVAVLY